MRAAIKWTMDIGESSPVTSKIVSHYMHGIHISGKDIFIKICRNVDKLKLKILFDSSSIKIFFNSPAYFWHVISFIQSEFRHWYCDCQFPSFLLLVESTSYFFDEVEEIVLVGKPATSVTGSRIFPVEVETVETIFVHKF